MQKSLLASLTLVTALMAGTAMAQAPAVEVEHPHANEVRQNIENKKEQIQEHKERVEERKHEREERREHRKHEREERREHKKERHEERKEHKEHEDVK